VRSWRSSRRHSRPGPTGELEDHRSMKRSSSSQGSRGGRRRTASRMRRAIRRRAEHIRAKRMDGPPTGPRRGGIAALYRRKSGWYSPVPGGASMGRGLAVPFRPGPIFGPVQACRTVGRRAGVVPGVWPTDGTHDASLNDFVRCGLSCSVSGSGKATWTLWWSCRRWPTSGRSWGNPLNPRRSARVYGCHCDHYLNDTRFRHSVPSDHSKVQP
jgi:hypothetical protein